MIQDSRVTLDRSQTGNRRPRVLVLTGDGLQCEQETADAFLQAGFEAEIRHLNDLIAERFHVDDLSRRYLALAIPGGFSFGDDIASGKVLALKMASGLNWDFAQFVARGGLVLGISNGFQALLRMGVFGKDLSITHNVHGRFVNQWVRLQPRGNRCVWLKGVGSLDLPIRHGEGRLVFSPFRRKELLAKMERQGMLCLTYEANPNGSEEDVAGICDATGRILGLMPHPEAFTRWTQHPEWTASPARASSPGQGLTFFENAYQEALKAMG